MKMLTAVLCLVVSLAGPLQADEPVAVATATGTEAETTPTPATKPAPDFAALDKDVLVLMCENLYARVQQLEQVIKDLQARLGATQGGSVAVVVGDTVAVDEGSWLVTISNNPVPDIAPLQAQILTEDAKLPDINKRLKAAQTQLSVMQSAKERYKTRKGNWKTRDKYDSSNMAPARKAVKEVKQDKRKVEIAVRKLKRQIEQMQSMRQISGVTDDGVAVTIIARGVYFNVGVALKEKATYQITGRGQIGKHTGKITLKNATLVEEQPVEQDDIPR
jgi:hypothetical protein